MVNLADAQVLVYQPQVSQWTDNQLTFRAALAIKPTGAKAESFGVIFASARTQVDKVLRTVVFENMTISKIDFPTLPDRGAAYGAELQGQFAQTIRTISLDRLEDSPALAGIKPPPVAVQNNPPWVIVSYAPAILVPIDGAPVMQAVPSNPQFQRVINTRALILQSGAGQPLYIHVYDGWLESNSISRPVVAVVQSALPASTRSRRHSPVPARWTCWTAAPRSTPSPRSPTACRRSTPARCPPSSSCSTASRISSRSRARNCCGRRIPPATC